MIKEFITENKDYKLRITKEESRFIKTSIFNFEIFNNLDTKLLEFNFTYSDLLNIIDNIEEFLSNDIDIYYSINCNEQVYIIGFYQQDIDVNFVTKPEDFYIKDIMHISTYKDDLVIKILSFEVTATLEELLTLLQELIE